MMLSVIFLTYRPGGIDVLCDSLRNQTFKDFELIVVDDYHIDRSEVIRRYIEKNGIRVQYVGGSKPKSIPHTPHGIANAYITGILQSTGKILVVLSDYVWLPPDSLEKIVIHESLLQKNTLISPIGRIYAREPKNQEKDFNGLTSIWKQPWEGSPQDNGWMDKHFWVGNPFELFYFAISREMAHNVGFSETWDYTMDMVTPLSRAIQEKGFHYFVDRDNICEIIDVKKWKPEWLWFPQGISPQEFSQQRKKAEEKRLEEVKYMYEILEETTR